MWVLADASHEEALNHFVCADPPKWLWDKHRGRHHPSKWELETQSAIRGLRLPVPEDEGVILAMFGSEIAGVIWLSFDVDETQLLVRAIATHIDYRGTGLGGRLLDEGLRLLEANRLYHQLDCAFWANIHSSNDASKHLFASRGFVDIDESPVGTSPAGLHTWAKAPGLV
ncbi:N-acetyltransferase [Rathayibacter rathayi]|uniref:N-acetyltransferase n=2 Tax=Rathayibacter rathayi TaxID=33887 RepID=A0ABD6WBQ8_RATRA|nr:N-acetyltransferase [Rathayibacter rathayi]PPF15903.1 N-acetyltransferase [Rathayibacter rathayi]PPF20745.1 N-acetyltransferase [Rathayibacter rathayi]PPF43286.1 N-acetyltransferase [Rathayibacter rathayi]PPF77959.1 N-acetyltransferase [Rathayibacter rathayi]